MISQENIKAYYDSLTDEQRLKAFCDMVCVLNEDQQIRYNDEMKLYWTSCGEPI